MKIRQAVISAGGVGTRLSSEIGNLPKILAELCGKNLLERHLENLELWGFERVLLLLGHGSDEVIKAVEKIRDKFHLEIQISKEEEPLGTGGALIAAEKYLDESFLYLHGDLFVNMPKTHLARIWEEQNIDFGIFVHVTNHPQDSDLVDFMDSRIVEFKTKPHATVIDKKSYGNAGIYFFNKYIFQNYFGSNYKIDLDREIIPNLLLSNFVGSATINNWEIRDIGTPERLIKTKTDLANGFLGKKIRPAVLIDRDGTINISKGYIRSKEELELYDGVAESISLLNAKGILVIVVTNQPVIARGEISLEELEIIHFEMEKKIMNSKGMINAIYFCPHHPELGHKGEISELKIKCKCRKPEPGLILKAIEDFGIDKQKCVMIGDTWRDELAAKSAEIKFIYVNENSGQNNFVESVNKAIEIISICDEN